MKEPSTTLETLAVVVVTAPVVVTGRVVRTMREVVVVDVVVSPSVVPPQGMHKMSSAPVDVDPEPTFHCNLPVEVYQHPCGFAPLSCVLAVVSDRPKYAAALSHSPMVGSGHVGNSQLVPDKK